MADADRVHHLGEPGVLQLQILQLQLLPATAIRERADDGADDGEDDEAGKGDDRGTTSLPRMAQGTATLPTTASTVAVSPTRSPPYQALISTPSSSTLNSTRSSGKTIALTSRLRLTNAEGQRGPQP